MPVCDVGRADVPEQLFDLDANRLVVDPPQGMRDPIGRDEIDVRFAIDLTVDDGVELGDLAVGQEDRTRGRPQRTV